MNSDKTRPFRHCSWEELRPESREAWCESIVAAIEEMRKPTEAIYLARPVIIYDRDDWAEIWRGAIDAALLPDPDKPAKASRVLL